MQDYYKYIFMKVKILLPSYNLKLENFSLIKANFI